MNIHKEGYPTIILSFVFCLAVAFAGNTYLPFAAAIILIVVLIAFFIFILSFFRNPVREIPQVSDKLIYAPADGKVVVIENTTENEYFKDERVQVSIFMSPLNVHVNRAPITGTIDYSQYHKGKYLVAWHPKSSTENERTTVVFNTGKTQILLRQIAGALARRIVNYAKVGETYNQGDDYGFIKFGSRVDIFLPVGTKVLVNLEEMVQGNKTLIAQLGT